MIENAVRFGAGWGVEGAPGFAHQGVLVRLEDAAALTRDEFLYGNVFLRPYGATEAGEPVYARVPPGEVA